MFHKYFFTIYENKKIWFRDPEVNQLFQKNKFEIKNHQNGDVYSEIIDPYEVSEPINWSGFFDKNLLELTFEDPEFGVWFKMAYEE